MVAPYCRLPHDSFACGWLHWLASFSWSHFATLTYANTPGTDANPGFQRALKTLDVFGADITRHGGQLFAVMERGAANLRIHWHLLGQATEPSIRLAERNWKASCGYTKLDAIDSLYGASSYLLKYVTKGYYAKDELPWRWYTPEWDDLKHRWKSAIVNG